MVEIEPTASEKRSSALNAESLARATAAMREDGMVVLRDVIDRRHIDSLLERSLKDLDKIVNRPDAPFNWNRGNVQQDPPPFPPFLFRDVLANDFAIQVTHSILGDGLFNAFYSGNTAMPSESRQPVHADIGQLWPDQQIAHPAYAIVVNIPLVDMGPENGSTEVWPGTHLDTSITIQSGDIKVPPERLEARRKVVPPIQPVVQAGNMLIRDMRLWHAGMPNRTERPRPMIAMIHHVAWWHTGRFPLHPDAEALLQHSVLRQHADYSNAKIDYTSSGQAHEFTDSK